MLKHKEYKQHFKLDESKLTRLLGVMRSRLDEDASTGYTDHFEVFYSPTSRDEFASLEAVLALENSRKHPIERLLITSSSRAGGDAARREIQVDFATERIASGDGSKEKVISVRVQSESASWASLTLAAVEEQIERTWQRHGPSVLGLVVLLASLAILLLAQFPAGAGEKLADSMWLQKTDLAQFNDVIRQERTLTDGELHRLATLQLRNLITAQNPRSAAGAETSRGTWLLLAPVLFLMGCAAVLMWTCYPNAVFYWGDGVERYQTVLRRRKLFWGLIITVGLTAVLGNMFARGLLSAWL